MGLYTKKITKQIIIMKLFRKINHYQSKIFQLKTLVLLFF